MLCQVGLYIPIFIHLSRHVTYIYKIKIHQGSKFTAEGVPATMYASRRAVQLARACRAGYSFPTRRPISLGAARIASAWSPTKVEPQRYKNAGLKSWRAPFLLFRRGYAGMYSIKALNQVWMEGSSSGIHTEREGPQT